MSNYMEFIKFPALNLYEKGRLGMGILYSQYLQNPERLQGQKASEWLTSVFGKGVYTTIWEPLLESKYGAIKDKIPARLMHATITRYFGTRSKTDGNEWMGYLSGGGLRLLLQGLERSILAVDGKISCGERVSRISDHEGGVVVTTNKGEYRFDRVISTVPTSLLCKLMPSFCDKISQNAQIEYLGVIRLALVLSKSLSPYYVTNLIDKNMPFTGIIELSKVVDTQELANQNLIMLPRYDIPSSVWYQKDDHEITETFLKPLKKTWPAIEKNLITARVDREKIVQAIWLEGSPSDKPLKSNNQRVWSVNAELAGNDTLNNNAIIRVANSVSKEFLKEIRKAKKYEGREL